MQDFWALYCQNIATEVFIFVVNTIDSVESVRESKMMLHELCKQESLQDSHLVLVFNSPIEKPKDVQILQYNEAMGIKDKPFPIDRQEQFETNFS